MAFPADVGAINVHPTPLCPNHLLELARCTLGRNKVYLVQMQADDRKRRRQSWRADT